MDAIIQEAAERFLDAKRRASLKERWNKLSNRGAERSAILGYTEDDVDRLICEDRDIHIAIGCSLALVQVPSRAITLPPPPAH
jgi:hypothetical protein